MLQGHSETNPGVYCAGVEPSPKAHAEQTGDGTEQICAAHLRRLQLNLLCLSPDQTAELKTPCNSGARLIRSPRCRAHVHTHNRLQCDQFCKIIFLSLSSERQTWMLVLWCVECVKLNEFISYGEQRYTKNIYYHYYYIIIIIA